MKTIPVSGVIGWDVTGQMIRDALAAANGDEIRAEFASPGGLVFDGLEIFNLFKNYEGPKSAHIIGLAASMASYIPMAFEKVTGEENLVMVIHNAWGLAAGDHNDMRKSADVFEGMSNILAGAYSKKTGKALAKIKADMDEEIYLYGQEAVDYGLVDEITGSAQASEDVAAAKTLAILNARAQIAGAQKLVKEYEGGDSPERVAALLDTMRPRAQTKQENQGVAAGAGSPAIKPKGSTKMTLEQLKADHPEAYAAAVAVGRDLGVKAEQDRFRELSAWTEGHNADTVKIATEAIHSGKSFAEVQSQLMSAASKGPRQLDGPNAPAIGTASLATASGASLAVEGMSAEDVQSLMAGNPAQGIKGMTIEEIRLNARKGA